MFVAVLAHMLVYLRKRGPQGRVLHRQIAVALPASAFGTPATAKTRGGFGYLTLSTDDAKESIQALSLHN